MQWEATDQFGNLYVGVSTATSFGELTPHLQSLAEKLRERFPDEPITVTLDLEYAEINGPNPESVSHVIQCAWLSEQTELSAEELRAAIGQVTGLPTNLQ